jgi:hypothetical protein
MGGGSTAIRGFVLQTLVALLDSLELETTLTPPARWTHVTIEPDLQGTEKVDVFVERS